MSGLTRREARDLGDAVTAIMEGCIASMEIEGELPQGEFMVVAATPEYAKEHPEKCVTIDPRSPEAVGLAKALGIIDT